MKYIIILFSTLILFLFSCKTKQPVEQNNQTTEIKSAETRTLGKVSHEYRATGCNTVVVVTNNNTEKPLILIPVDALSKELDKDGLQIYFEYKLLKMRNPPGCSKGIPATLLNITKK